jgi:2-dehydropantoate 2-reductase
MKEPHWHVLGAGAIGCLYAQALHRSGCKTTLIMRRGTKVEPLTVIVEQGQLRSEHCLPAITPGSAAHVSHLLITTKAYDVQEAVASVAHLLRPSCVVVLLINGMGLSEQLAKAWPALDIYCGTTTDGAYSIAARHIQHAGLGETRIGSRLQATPPAWFGQWQQALESCVWDADIDAALWLKLAVNCVINPLTALHHCRNGQLAADVALAQQVERVCDEVSTISRAAGFAGIAANLAATVAAVIASTADNRSSMLQDVLRGSRTEIDYITGYLLQVADQHGIVAPHNRALLERIKKRAN